MVGGGRRLATTGSLSNLKRELQSSVSNQLGVPSEVYATTSSIKTLYSFRPLVTNLPPALGWGVISTPKFCYVIVGLFQTNGNLTILIGCICDKEGVCVGRGRYLPIPFD